MSFIGPSYNLKRRAASTQRTVNLVPVPIEPGNERSAWVFKDVPGLVPFFSETKLFYVSLLYPVLAEDSVRSQMPSTTAAVVWGIPDEQIVSTMPSIVSATLQSSINPLNYVNQRDVGPDTLNSLVPRPQSGTLTFPINVINYTNQRDVGPDAINLLVPRPISGTLVVTILFVNYTNQRDVAPDTTNSLVPLPLSGTLV